MIKPIDHSSISEKRERLLLACQLDLLNLRMAMRPAPVNGLALSALDMLAAISPRIPGKVGRWAKNITRGISLFRGVFESLSP